MQKRFPLVRNSVGLSRNLRNNAVYDRRWDWVLIGPAEGATRIAADGGGPAGRDTSPGRAAGPTLELVFRPRFYQKHRELTFFEPWTYRVWKGSVAGYCSWWSYREGINQQVVDSLVDVFAAKKLPDFGYKYLQLDAGYAPGGGGPKSFLEWDKNKFPGGAEGAVKKIKSAGMNPGIWVHRVYRSYVDRYLPDIGKQHPDWFVTKQDGTIYQGGYGIWTLNTRNKEALDAMVRPLFRELKTAGLGLCEDRRRGRYAVLRQGQTGRRTLQADRLDARTIAPRLGPRGPRGTRQGHLYPHLLGRRAGPRSIGLADGCRLGSDGFQWNTLLGNSSTNGVLWRGDPDHCDIMAAGAKDKTTDEDLRRRRGDVRHDRPTLRGIDGRQHAVGQRQGRGLQGRQQP